MGRLAPGHRGRSVGDLEWHIPHTATCKVPGACSPTACFNVVLSLLTAIPLKFFLKIIKRTSHGDYVWGAVAIPWSWGADSRIVENEEQRGRDHSCAGLGAEAVGVRTLPASPCRPEACHRVSLAMSGDVCLSGAV